MIELFLFLFGCFVGRYGTLLEERMLTKKPATPDSKPQDFTPFGDKKVLFPKEFNAQRPVPAAGGCPLHLDRNTQVVAERLMEDLRDEVLQNPGEWIELAATRYCSDMVMLHGKLTVLPPREKGVQWKDG